MAKRISDSCCPLSPLIHHRPHCCCHPYRHRHRPHRAGPPIPDANIIADFTHRTTPVALAVPTVASTTTNACIAGICGVASAWRAPFGAYAIGACTSALTTIGPGAFWPKELPVTPMLVTESAPLTPPPPRTEHQQGSDLLSRVEEARSSEIIFPLLVLSL